MSHGGTLCQLERPKLFRPPDTHGVALHFASHPSSPETGNISDNISQNCVLLGISTPENSRRFNSAETGRINSYNQKDSIHNLRISSRRTRVHPESREYSTKSGYYKGMGDEHESDVVLNKRKLSVDTSSKIDDEERQATPATAASTPRTPANIRGSRDLRSPGEQMTPVTQVAKLTSNQRLPDFITQTDANGNATTPRSSQAIQGARTYHPSGPKPRLHVDDDGNLSEDDNSKDGKEEEDPCEALFENMRMMCCCLMDDHHVKLEGIATEDSDQPIKLLGPLHPNDTGKKCLVLDLDETLVHSSFRPVPNSDFVIPVEVRHTLLRAGTVVLSSR